MTHNSRALNRSTLCLMFPARSIPSALEVPSIYQSVTIVKALAWDLDHVKHQGVAAGLGGSAWGGGPGFVPLAASEPGHPPDIHAPQVFSVCGICDQPVGMAFT